LTAAGSSYKKLVVQLQESLVQPRTEQSQCKEFSKISLTDGSSLIRS